MGPGMPTTRGAQLPSSKVVLLPVRDDKNEKKRQRRAFAHKNTHKSQRSTSGRIAIHCLRPITYMQGRNIFLQSEKAENLKLVP